MTETLMKVVATLNMIKVSGKDNLDMLLGCIMLLEHIINEQEAKQNANDHAGEWKDV